MMLDHILDSKETRAADILPKTKESVGRSLAKTVSWRVIGTLDTILISWLITGAWTFALSIGGIELITKMILYFFHERVWNFFNHG